MVIGLSVGSYAGACVHDKMREKYPNAYATECILEKGMEYHIIDVFTDKLFGGNPAGVCLLDEWLPDSILQSIAAENNLSETAFLIKQDNYYDLRWFTPTIEVDLFQRRLMPPQSDLAEQTMKAPYMFDFIPYREGMIEREIESELVKNITKLLLELGTGFAFMGNQFHIEVENEDFYIDLMFYNLKLRCYVVIELKTGDFIPEYAGKLNFYISAVDDLMKTEQDNPTIGLLLCKNKRGMIAEYSLRDIEKPIGVSEYKLFKSLPKEYENILPSAEDIEKRIGEISDDED